VDDRRPAEQERRRTAALVYGEHVVSQPSSGRDELDQRVVEASGSRAPARITGLHSGQNIWRFPGRRGARWMRPSTSPVGVRTSTHAPSATPSRPASSGEMSSQEPPPRDVLGPLVQFRAAGSAGFLLGTGDAGRCRSWTQTLTPTAFRTFLGENVPPVGRDPAK
jgi:hypothetical protein